MNKTQKRTLILENGQHRDTTLFHLEKDWVLEFCLGPSLFGKKVTIFTNFPSAEKLFVRQIYKPLIWENTSVGDDTSCCSLRMTESGSFHYYFQCDDELSKCGSGYLVVDPVLQCNSSLVPLNCIQCITFLSKNLGSFSRWQKKLQVAKECGYNMIHFTPIQELGASQSGYSLTDQLQINSQFLDEKYSKITMDDVTDLMETLRNEWTMLSVCDIVLNHTANESHWLQEHPECAYNMINSPYLKAAYLLDITLHNYSLQVAKGVWKLNGVPELIDTEEHLGALRYTLSDIILPQVKIEELFIVSVDTLVSEFLTKCLSLPPPKGNHDGNLSPDLEIIQDSLYRRMKSTIDMKLAISRYNVFRNDSFDEETRIRKCVLDFKNRLEYLNDRINQELNYHLTDAINNVIAGVRYFRVEQDGPRLGAITLKAPLFTRYFTDYKDEPSERHAYTENGSFIMAHNGWVMNANPLKNFAEQDSQTYLRRELIAWGDSVKLRYGDCPEDCPYLWKRMREYVEQTARTFDGVRLDNCHSTPIHVAEYLLDAARLIKPNLYVIAELFTNSDHTDNLFVNRLGITSLIRESMSAWDSHELGRLVYRYGGDPVGAFIKPLSKPLIPSIARALFLDLSHDNPCPIEKRTVFYLLPSSALVSMACCASGSNMGYDELVPHQIDVVEENRTYPEWGNEIDEKVGIIEGKKALNELHYYLGMNGYYQIFVDQVSPDIVCVTRHNSCTHESVILASYTSFSNPNAFASGEHKGVIVTGYADNILFEAYLAHKSPSRYSTQIGFIKNESFINGLTDYELKIVTNIKAEEASMVRLEKKSNNTTHIDFTNQFKPGSVIAIKFVQANNIQESLKEVAEYPTLLPEIANELTLADMNKIFHCCNNESGAVYQIPNFAPLVYCGLQGIISFMDIIASNNDLGHPICHNLREGDWMIDYTLNRLKNNAGTVKLGKWLEKIFEPVKNIPRYLIPCYFYFIINGLYDQLIELTFSLMPGTINKTSKFSKLLALGSVQFGGIVESSTLPSLSKNMRSPRPSVVAGTEIPICVTLSAGLPHFASGYMRNWGRDTFIALRGLFLLTGRYDEARYIILGYAGCLRHGLIPNLLNGGRNARYNCRDAVWWWLYTIQHYVTIVPQGEEILTDTVNRLYPTDESPPSSIDQPLHDVIQEAMDKHFQGLCFRERNAGVTIDACMKSAGFDNQIGVHPDTGFVFGGNEWNCGTWMDKMGSSDKAQNRGQPATPRDGTAIEILALCKSAVSWLAHMHSKKLYPYEGVERESNKNGSKTFWTYATWANKIENNFEKYFWIAKDLSRDDPHPDLIHRQEIYKDCYGATQAWTDYQLRCNYSIAMVIAPELFNPQNAWAALETARLNLVGPLGMKTLDSADWAYNGFYDNTNDSTNPKIARGFNYHQGPEWLWPIGYFVRARLYFATRLNDKSLISKVLSESKTYLANHFTHLQKSDWRGLPELTNKDGAYCPFSCPTQAWSMASILEAVHDLEEIESSFVFKNIEV